MMVIPTRHRAVITIFVAWSIVGCHRDYRATTVLHSDGSVDREILQPQETADNQALRSKGWATVGSVEHKSGTGGANSPRYFTASGHFASPAAIPEHFLCPAGTEAKPGEPQGRLVRRFLKTDYVFVNDYQWVETLSDVVTPDSIKSGRDELADRAIDFEMAVFKEVLGQDYDASELEKWLRGEGKRWLGELADAAVVQTLSYPDETFVPAGADRSNRILDALSEICARHGLILREHGQLKSEQIGRVCEEFAINLICRTVKTRVLHRPVDRKTVLAWNAELKAADKEGQRTQRRVKAAVDHVMAVQYGTEEKCRESFSKLMTQVIGVYWINIMTTMDFDYMLTVPGQVVWTNGLSLEENRVRWKFNAFEAWPFGYAMACRSLEPLVEAQKKLLGTTPLVNRQDMLEFIELVGTAVSLKESVEDGKQQNDRGPALTVRDLLDKCRREGSMASVYNRRDQLKAACGPDLKTTKQPSSSSNHDGGPGEQLRQMNRLLELLNLPPSTPS
jgi:hypothetical protein